MISRTLRVLAVACGLCLARSEVHAQAAVSEVAVVDHCPMPVFGSGSRDTMLSFMPDPTVEQARALRRWFVEQSDTAKATRSRPPSQR
jgi:hypothetical protein